MFGMSTLPAITEDVPKVFAGMVNRAKLVVAVVLNV